MDFDNSKFQALFERTATEGSLQKFTDDCVKRFVLIPVKTNLVGYADFGDERIFVIFAQNTINLAFGNEYHAGVMVQYTNHKTIETDTFYILGTAVIVGDCMVLPSASPVVPVNHGGIKDVIWNPDPELIELHLREVYRDTPWVEFEEEMKRLRRLNPRITQNDDGTIVIKTN